MNIRALSGIGILLLIIITLSSCRLDETKEWDVNGLAPLAEAELSINNLVRDTSLIKKESDNSLTLVYRQEVKAVQIGDLLQVPDTQLASSVNLKQISLGNRRVTRKVTLGEVARNAGLVGAAILFNHGKKMAVPPQSNLTNGPTDINATNLFQSATFIDGKLELSVYNGFPIELTDIDLEVSNNNAGSTIFTDLIPSIKPKQSYKKVFPLAGKTVEGQMVARIKSMNSPGSSNPVLIDTNDALTIMLTAFELQVREATAIFPAQNLIEKNEDVPYDLDGAEIKFMNIKEGTIKIRVNHTVPESLRVHYRIPGAAKNGKVLDLNTMVPPATGGQASYITETYAVDGYDVDLTGKNKNTSSTFNNELSVRIDSTGKMQHLSLQDSLFISYGLFSVIPQYARGYLGKKKITIGPSAINVDAFSNITDGQLDIPNLKVNLEVSNGIGAESNFRLESLKAINTRTGKSVSFTGSALQGDINLKPAIDNPLRPGITNIALTKDNSNIKDMLSIRPDRLEYKLTVNLNPNGNSSNFNDFVYYESAVGVNLNVEVPLELEASGLVMADTVQLDPDQFAPADDRLREATIHLFTENSFPLNAGIQIYTFRNGGDILDSLLIQPNTQINASKIDGGTGRTTEASRSHLVAHLDEEKWKDLRLDRRMILKVNLATIPAGQAVKLYSDYRIKAKVSADVRYRVSTK